MTNETKQTAVDIIYQGMSDKIVMQDLNKALISIHISHDDFLKLHKQAKEMEKQILFDAQMDMFHFLNNLEFGMQYLDKREQAEEYCKQYYNQTYGGNK